MRDSLALELISEVYYWSGDESTRGSVMLVQFDPFAHFANFRELVFLGVFAGFEVESVPYDVVGIGIRRRG